MPQEAFTNYAITFILLFVTFIVTNVKYFFDTDFVRRLLNRHWYHKTHGVKVIFQPKFRAILAVPVGRI